MNRIILIGFMGAGKSSLGKKIARRLNMPFIDSDVEISRLHSKSIGEIFKEKGENGFREIEMDFIDNLSTEGDFVLATGGGMPCFGNAMGKLNALGLTFYLKRSPKELMHRLINAKKERPLIAGLSENELLVFIENKIEERTVYYSKSTFVLERDEQNVGKFEEIIRLLQAPEGQSLQKS